MLEPVKVDGLEFVLEDLNNLFLAEPDKLEREFRDLRGNLTLCVLLLFTSLGSGPLGLTFTTRRRQSNCGDLGIRLPIKTFQLKLKPYLYGVFLRLDLLKVDLGL